VLAQIAAALYGRPAPQVPQGAALAGMVAAHYEAILSFYGRDLGIRTARKHLSWYLEEAGAMVHRADIVTSTDPVQVIHLIRCSFDGSERAAA